MFATPFIRGGALAAYKGSSALEVKAGWRPAKKKAATLDLLHPMPNTCRPDKLIDTLFKKYKVHG